MDAEKNPGVPPTGGAESPEPVERFPELAEIQQEVEKRIRDNKRFLERFMDEDYIDEDDESESEGDDEVFEEL